LTELEEKEAQLVILEDELSLLYEEARKIGGERWRVAAVIKEKLGPIADLKKQINEMGGRNRKL